jgi:hypothetical protein
MGRHDRWLRRLCAASNRCTKYITGGLWHHGATLVRLLARATAVPFACLFAIQLHQTGRIVRQKTAHVVAVLEFVGLLDKVIGVAVRAVIREMPAVGHARGAFEMLVVACMHAGGRSWNSARGKCGTGG